eukprot:TRINITY_DN33856_c0_g1_i3.p1 TRINITY_DN33856_c0_g1~~TRINITY_DN33856_c0_g1_i3.p1  ORF type:complete len:104 (-),score=6.96 TRINITY_DN33856_c0_g1_i3:34-345(-)
MPNTWGVSTAQIAWYGHIQFLAKARSGGYLLDTSFANSFILYQLSPNHDELSELDYLKQLALELISTISGEEEVQPRPQRKKTNVANLPRMTAGNHWPKKAKK